ncbi:hypothetical protein [Variovorax sp. GT1P44]|uniref:hypothetical protein n=1 Tax=Variovorax sp. GT1P44 TaxID=3443742 RepID=UPI003F481819
MDATSRKAEKLILVRFEKAKRTSGYGRLPKSSIAQTTSALARASKTNSKLPSMPSGSDLAALSARAVAQIEELREAYRAVTCVHELLLQVHSLPKDKRHFDFREVEALIDFIDAECQRRAQTALATIASMREPPAF